MYLTWSTQPSHGLGLVTVDSSDNRISGIDVGWVMLKRVPCGWVGILDRSWVVR